MSTTRFFSASLLFMPFTWALSAKTQISQVQIPQNHITKAHISQTHIYQTKYVSVTISDGGYIKSIRDNASGKEYCPKGDSSALLSLCKDKGLIKPSSAVFARDKGQIVLHYPNGSTAIVQIAQKPDYLILRLLSLSPRNGVDNIIWGPYKTNISQTIGEIISVVRDNDFAIGIQALDMNTTSGPPSEGDLPQSYYIIHAPPGVTLPGNLHEGQIFNIGGDSLGSSDVAFFSQPEEYYRYVLGNGAMLAPYGSDIVLHARDRRIPQTINFRPFTMSPDRHQYVYPVDADFLGSGVAFFGCPTPKSLQVIGNIELGEGLPHPMLDGRWVKDPLSAKPFLAWYGVHDSLVSYARQLEFKAVQDEGLGEYYYNPANKWGNKRINFSDRSMSIKEYTDITNKAGIAYGLHTLCEFIQPGSSDVNPVPNDSLCKVGSTVITHSITADDSLITIADPTWLLESGGWEDTRTNVLKIGKELIRYDGVSVVQPYTLINPKRGWHHTIPGKHNANDSIDKLMPNAYNGFAPDIALQDKYAQAYAQLLNEGGMDYIDFDGLESCWYQGHGQYSIKRFYDKLFKGLNHYIRNTGSCVFEGNWHYISSLDVGGDLFDPAANTFKIQGKDFKQIYFSNLLHFSFGIVNFSSTWDASVAENLETRAIGWDGQYMLGLGQEGVEKCGEKQAIFKTIREWEEARNGDVFTAAQKAKFRVLENRFHLERVSGKSWRLYPVLRQNFVIGVDEKEANQRNIKNPFNDQPLQFTMQVSGAPGASVALQSLKDNNGAEMVINAVLHTGQRLICKNRKLYIADETWNKLSDLPVRSIPILRTGNNEIALGGITSADKSIKLNFVFSVAGTPEVLRKPK